MSLIKNLLLTATLFATATTAAAERPRLVINIIAGSMQAEALERYTSNLDRGGFARLTSRGITFTEACYGCMQTTTPTSLATLATGATPATHGIVGSRWYDYTVEKFVDLTADKNVKTLGSNNINNIKEGHSPQNMVAPTLTDALLRSDRLSRAVTIALTPASAITTAGRSGCCLWTEGENCQWVTSTAYAEKLPVWVDEYNTQEMNARFINRDWVCRYSRDKYINKRSLGAALYPSEKRSKSAKDKITPKERITATPAGNSLVFDLAKQALTALNLGADDHPDIINICLDAADEIAARYGCESVEYEDMLYHLDNDIKELLDYAAVHTNYSEDIVVVFTSAHGCAPAYDAATPQQDRFNSRQFELIINAFLNARYGQGQWVLGYADRALYLNRNLIRDKRLSLEMIQSEAAAFALQFRGISHAITATTLQSSYFVDGYASKIQRGFYPRRSGDIIINLFPERTTISDTHRTESGSMYKYDTHVPLIIYGMGITAGKYDKPVDMTCVAPTLARLLHISAPSAAEGNTLDFEY